MTTFDDPALPGMPPPLTVVTGGADDAGEITLVCSVCGDEITGPEHGRGNAKGKLGIHKWSKHQIRSTPAGKGRKGRARPDADDYTAAPVTSVLRDAVAEIDRGAGAPTAAALSRAGGRALEIGSSLIALHVVDSDPFIPVDVTGDAMRADLVHDLAIDKRTAEGIMRPLGTLLAPTKLNKRYGRGAVENVDVLLAIGELGAIMTRWRRYLSGRSMMRQAQEIGAAAGAPVPAATMAPPLNVNTPPASPTPAGNGAPPMGPSATINHGIAPPGTVIGMSPGGQR